MAARVKGLVEMFLSPTLPSCRRGVSPMRQSKAIAAVLSLAIALSVATGLMLAGVPPAPPALAAKSSVTPKATTEHYTDLLRFTGTSGGGMPAALAFRRQTPLTHVIPNTLSSRNLPPSSQCHRPRHLLKAA
jgi:hypothetical protein